MYNTYYQINTREELQRFFETYVPLVVLVLQSFGVGDKFKLEVDHLGLQVVSKEEFDLTHSLLTCYCETINKGVIHGRRNNLYKLNQPIKHGGFDLKYVEIFEPKADADIYKLKLGFEHISFYSSSFEELLTHLKTNDIPIAKQVEMHGSKFLKTTFMNLVEIEFRNDYLYQAIELERQFN